MVKGLLFDEFEGDHKRAVECINANNSKTKDKIRATCRRAYYSYKERGFLKLAMFYKRVSEKLL